MPPHRRREGRTMKSSPRDPVREAVCEITREYITWGRTAGAGAARRRSRSVSSAVPPCCTLCCSKWHHVAAGTADLGGRRGKWRSRSRPRSRASADPRATFGPGRRRSARRSCRSIPRRRRRSTWDSTADLPASHTADHRAVTREMNFYEGYFTRGREATWIKLGKIYFACAEYFFIKNNLYIIII